MVDNTKLLMIHLRNKLFRPQKTNRQMNMLVVGPKEQGRLLQRLLYDDEKSKDNGNQPSILKPSKPYILLLFFVLFFMLIFLLNFSLLILKCSEITLYIDHIILLLSGHTGHF